MPPIDYSAKLTEPISTNDLRVNASDPAQLASTVRGHPGRGMYVAVIGPDGAGKTTLVQALQASSVLPVTMIYMGGHYASANFILPTTRWLLKHGLIYAGSASEIAAIRPRPKSLAQRLRRRIRNVVALAYELVEYSYRFRVAYTAKRRGMVVLFDRYIYDALVDTLVDRPSRVQRLRAQLFARIFPRPDLVLALEAPGSLLFTRKREYTPERLESIQRAWRQIAANLPGVEYLDATQSPTAVLQDAVARIQCYRGYAQT